MSKRYYICPVIGDGSEDNPYRTKAAIYDTLGTGASIPGNADPQSPDYGKPLYPVCLTIVSATDHSAIEADPEIDALPDFPLDGKMSAISIDAHDHMIAVLSSHGYATAFVDQTDGYRDVIELIGKQRDPSFSLDAFNIL